MRRVRSPAEQPARSGRLETAGSRWQTLAQAHAERRDRSAFLDAIVCARACAAALPAAAAGSNDFTALEVLQEWGHGHALLEDPERALGIYGEAERRAGFRPAK